MGMSLEELREMLGGGDHSELTELVKENTTQLQDDSELEEGRLFSSHIMNPFESEVESTSRGYVYSSIDSREVGIEDVFNEHELDDDNPLKMLMKMMADRKVVVSFSVTCAKDVTTIRTLKNGEIMDAFSYTNVQSADDLLKLVSFHDKQFVDPVLKDFDSIKTVFAN